MAKGLPPRKKPSFRKSNPLSVFARMRKKTGIVVKARASLRIPATHTPRHPNRGIHARIALGAAASSHARAKDKRTKSYRD